MDENQEKENVNNEASSENQNASFNINKEDLKKETADTVNQVKETIKNVDFKKDSKEAKGFITSFFKDPLGELRKVVNGSKNSFLKVAIIILVVWLVAILISNVFGVAKVYLFGTYGSFSYFFKHFFSNILSLFKELVAPVISIALLAGLVYGFKKQKNKSFLDIASTILVAKLPIVIAQIVSLLTIIGSGISKITSTFSGFCSILSTVLLFFAIKELSDEEKNDSYFWKFALIMGIFYIAKFILSYLGIYL